MNNDDSSCGGIVGSRHREPQDAGQHGRHDREDRSSGWSASCRACGPNRAWPDLLVARDHRIGNRGGPRIRVFGERLMHVRTNLPAERVRFRQQFLSFPRCASSTDGSPCTAVRPLLGRGETGQLHQFAALRWPPESAGRHPAGAWPPRPRWAARATAAPLPRAGRSRRSGQFPRVASRSIRRAEGSDPSPHRQ